MSSQEPKTILIIEDDSFLSSIYAKKFSYEGYEVIQALDGKKGLSLIKQKKPDLVFLDIMLPEMNGLDVLEQAKKDEEIKNIPIVLLTNASEKDKIDKGFALGAKDYIIKVFASPQEILEKAEKYIK